MKVIDHVTVPQEKKRRTIANLNKGNRNMGSPEPTFYREICYLEPIKTNHRAVHRKQTETIMGSTELHFEGE